MEFLVAMKMPPNQFLDKVLRKGLAAVLVCGILEGDDVVPQNLLL